MILKAGTYRFNNDLSGIPTENPYAPIEFYLPLLDPTGNEKVNGFSFYGEVDGATNLLCYGIGNSLYVYWHGSLNGFVSNGWAGGIADYEGLTNEQLQTHTITQDTEVDDTFGTWYISNTNYNEVNATPFATIEYNGQTIAELNAGETAVLKCGPTEDTKYVMASDVVVKVDSGYVKPSGSVTVTENSTVDVTGKKEVVVDVKPYTIYWDGVTDNKPTIEYDGLVFYKVSDTVLSSTDLSNCLLVQCGYEHPNTHDAVFTSDEVAVLGDGVLAIISGECCVISGTVNQEIGVTESGTYFLSNASLYITALIIP